MKAVVVPGFTAAMLHASADFAAGLAVEFGRLAGAARRRGNHRYFRDQAFHFQTLRALNNIRSDGADTAEVLEIIGGIREGDTESWHDSWQSAANRVLERADRICDARSRGEALLRAHNYLRTAEFFLVPADPRRPIAFTRNVAAF